VADNQNQKPSFSGEGGEKTPRNMAAWFFLLLAVLLCILLYYNSQSSENKSKKGINELMALLKQDAIEEIIFYPNEKIVWALKSREKKKVFADYLTDTLHGNLYLAFQLHCHFF